MTPEELDNKFNKVVSDIQGNEFGKIMGQVASNALALIRQRVQEEGKDAEGNPFKPYSIKPMLSGCSGFLNKSKCPAASKGKRKELKWITLGGRDKGFSSFLEVSAGGQGPSASGYKRLFEIPGGYKEFRELNGLQTNHVDFTFSGSMWGNSKVQGDIKVISNSSEHNSGIARIGPTTELNKNKLRGNTEKRGPILKLSQKELRDISEEFNMGIVQIFHNNGL